MILLDVNCETQGEVGSLKGPQRQKSMSLCWLLFGSRPSMWMMNCPGVLILMWNHAGQGFEPKQPMSGMFSLAVFAGAVNVMISEVQKGSESAQWSFRVVPLSYSKKMSKSIEVTRFSGK